MMKKLPIALFSIAVVLITCFSACKVGCIHGSGNSQTQTFKLSDFSKIDIEGGYKVVLKQDSSQAVVLTADDNFFKYVKVETSGNRLKVYSKKNFCEKVPMTLTIGVRHLEQLSLSGAMDVTAQGKLNLQDLKIGIAGANKINLDINANNVETSASGANELHLAGQAAAHKIDFSGEGRLYAFDFVVGKYRIETSGASQCEVNVLNELSVNSSGSSDIKYKGSPSTIHNDHSGAGSLQKVQ